MLQSLRDNLKGTVAIIIVGLMIIPFALFGVDSLFLQDGSAGKAAEVNGEVISEMQLARAVQLQKQQIIQRFGDQAPAELLVDEELRGPVLTRLLRRELLRQAAANGGMAVSETSIDQLIVSTPQFQQDGKFSPELYTQLLRNMGYTPASYKKLLIEDILINQHASGVSNSAFATRQDLDRLTALTQQQRSFYYITLPFESVQAQVEVGDEELRAYYENNRATFMRPEQVAVEYIELSLDELAANSFVDPQAVRDQYQQEVRNFKALTQRHVAHILIEDDDGAEDIVAEVKQKLAAGESFETLAKTYSQDLGSSELGGDLGMTDGSTFPESFEAAAAELEVGQVSGVVETDAGFHFIKLLGQSVTEAPEFEEAQSRIKEELAFAAAESTFIELLEALPDATYNVASLKQAADQLGLEVKVSEYFDRSGGVGVLANNQVKAAIFSDDVLHQRLSSDVLELSNNHVVVVKLKDRKPEALRPFEEVEQEIVNLLTEEKVRTILAERAAQLLAELKGGAKIQELAETSQLEWQVKADTMRNDPAVNRELLSHIFTLPKPQDKPVNTSLPLANGDYVVAQLTVVKPGKLPDMDAAQLASFRQRLAQDYGNSDLAVYQSALEARSDVELYQ